MKVTGNLDTSYGGSYNLSITGSSNRFDGDFTFFYNTGELTIGDAPGDKTTFTKGVYTSGPSMTNIAGTIETNSQPLDLGDVTLKANTILNTHALNSGGVINFYGALTGQGYDLTLTTGHVSGADILAYSPLSGLGTLTINDVDMAIFWEPVVNTNTVSVINALSYVDFLNELTTQTLTVSPGNYRFYLDGLTGEITNPVTFLNTARVGLGYESGGGTLKFDGGFTATAPLRVSLFGSILTPGQEISIGNSLGIIDMGADTVLDTTYNSPAGAAIHLLTTVDGAYALTLNAGTGGDITAAGAIGGLTPISGLTISDAHNVSLQAASTTGAVTQNAGSGTTTLNGVVTSGGDVGITTQVITLSGPGSINAGANSVTLNAQTGAIVGGSAATDITAANLILSAATGVGSLGNPLLTMINNLQADNSTSGDIVVSNTGDLNINGSGIHNLYGSVNLTGSSNITLTSALTALDANIIAHGSILDDADHGAVDLTTTADARLEATTGTIGTPALPLTFDVGGTFSLLAGGVTDMFSIVFNGQVGNIQFLNSPPGLFLVNDRISGGNPQQLSRLYQGIFLLNQDEIDPLHQSFFLRGFKFWDLNKLFYIPKDLIQWDSYLGI
ncbi:MAG: hypothetical protein HQL15_10190 [Candidatus Omnitrophica bacterium]|nr:hypothetical protein [Candidatus Omnitrophota bacterium]